MKFWQKAFFAGLLLFLVGFDALGFTLARRSYELNAGYALQTALMEQGVIEKSLYDNIMNSAPQFTQLNSENLRFAVAPYAAYYKNQGVAMAVYLDGPAVYNGFPAYTPKGTGENEKAIVLQEINNNLFCVIESHLPAPLDTLVFIYAKDESALTAFRTDVTRLFLFISGIAAVLLGGALLFMLIGLTRPFRKLSAAAAEISGGDYNNRAAVKGSDEIADFANSFNRMAGSIQSRIAELTRLNESREQFINNLSHELRTPITAVAGYAELLKIGSISDEERERSIGYIADQIRRIQQMSQKLMALTQIPFCAIQKQWVSLESAAANAAMTCAEQLNKKVIGLNMDLQAVNAYGDAVLIESLLQNLLENAVKASQQGGVVTISSRLIEESGDCVLWVADNGRGMASEEIAKVTEPFYRIDKARARKDGGAGLGLALCAKICDVHSAKMEIFSEPEKGAAIEITFYNTVTTS